MNPLTQLHNDERGNIWAWLEVIAGLFCLIVGYTIGIPLNYIVANMLIEVGAPAASIFFLEKLLVWTFIGMGILLIAWGLSLIHI